MLVDDRLLPIKLLGQLDNPFSSHRSRTFEAVDIEVNRTVILRVVHSEDSALTTPLENTVLALRQIHFPTPHPGIMQLVDGDEFGYFTWQIRYESDVHCMVTQKIGGITLYDWLGANGAADEVLTVKWLKQLLSAVNVLHTTGFIHRDIKPDNIMVASDQRLVLIDFDAICRIDALAVEPVARIGTPEYMAPEQSQGYPRPISDYYSIGRTVIEMLTGKSPSELTQTDMGSINWKKEAPNVSRQLTALIDKLANKNALYRPTTVEEVFNYLEGAKRWTAPLEKKESWQYGLNVLARVTFSVALLASLASLAALMGFGLGMTSQAQPEPDRLLAEGNQLILSGKTEAGLSLIERAIELDPDSIELLSSKAIAHSFMGDDASAIESYEAALKIEPDSAELLYNLGNAYEPVDMQKAITSYRAASKMDSPIKAQALNNLARAYLLTEQIQLAEAVMARIPTDIYDPLTRTAVFKNSGWLNFEKGNFDAAKAALWQAVDTDPTQADAYCLLALIQQQSGEDNFNDRVTCTTLPMLENKPEVEAWKSQLLPQAEQ